VCVCVCVCVYCATAGGRTTVLEKVDGRCREGVDAGKIL
jgi:hypothetical protein